MHVLAIADDFNEVSEILHTLQQTDTKNRLHHIGDVDEARAYLLHEEPYKNAPCPSLVLLDASLSQKGGLELLADVKTDPQFSGPYATVFIGSDTECHLLANSSHAVDGCIRKPIDTREFARVLTSVCTASLKSNQ